MASRTASGVVAALAGLALAGGVVACGDDERPALTGTATAPVMSTATQTTTVPTVTATTPTATTPVVPPEEEQGGAGDEEAIRVPATFTFTGGGEVRPPEIGVPAFLTIELTGVSRDGEAHTMRFEGTTIEVPAGGRASARFEGLEDGRYPVTIDGREGAATIVSGVDPGP